MLEQEKQFFLMKYLSNFIIISLQKQNMNYLMKNDPVWDYSGELIEIGGFNIDDYDKLKDFFEEYTGRKLASHQSGRGWNFEDYEEIYYFEITYKYLLEVFRKTINLLMENQEKSLLKFMKKNSL